jgi:hypothetical protein
MIDLKLALLWCWRPDYNLVRRLSGKFPNLLSSAPASTTNRICVMPWHNGNIGKLLSENCNMLFCLVIVLRVVMSTSVTCACWSLFKMSDFHEQRICVKFCVKLGKSFTETFEMLKNSIWEWGFRPDSNVRMVETFQRWPNSDDDDDPHSQYPKRIKLLQKLGKSFVLSFNSSRGSRRSKHFEDCLSWQTGSMLGGQTDGCSMLTMCPRTHRY